MHLSYGELEDFLAHIHHVAPEKRTALKGRLKHFQRLGWPAGTNKGKGARVEYGIGQTMCLAMGMEMLQLGLTPERVVDQFKFGGVTLARGFIDCLNEYGPDADTLFYIFSPESLHALRGDDDSPFGVKSLMVSRSKLMEALAPAAQMGNWRRFAFVDMSDLFDRYVMFFVDKGLGDPQQLRQPLERWQKIEAAALERWQAHVMEGYPLGDDTEA